MEIINKRLYRYADGQVLGGVLLGFARYFTLDVVMLRVFFSFFVLITGFFPGVAAYIAALFIMPIKNNDDVIEL